MSLYLTTQSLPWMGGKKLNRVRGKLLAKNWNLNCQNV